MNLLILGAAGAPGRLLVEQALAAGHRVRALVRTPDKLTARHTDDVAQRRSVAIAA